MRVDHGSDRGKSLPKFGVGDANANCPPDPLVGALVVTLRTCYGAIQIVVLLLLLLLPYRYKKERFMAFKIRQNPFPAWAPDPTWEITTLPQTLGHPSPYPLHSAPTHLRRSPCVHREF